MIRLVNTRIGQVDVAPIECEREILPQDPVKPDSRLEIEFESCAQVWAPNVSCRDTGAAVNKWVQPRAWQEMIARDRREPNQVGAIGVKLCATPQFAGQFHMAEKRPSRLQQFSNVQRSCREMV